MKKPLLIAMIVIATTLFFATPALGVAYQPVGKVLGNYKGFPVYGNGKEGNGVFPYQCVELTKRFYKLVYEIDTSKWKGNGNQYFGTAKAKGLIAFSNGGSVPPQVGDIIAFDGTLWGHVAIVIKVDENYVYFIQENAYPWTDKIPIKKNNGSNYTVSSKGKLYVQGWLRLPQNNDSDNSLSESDRRFNTPITKTQPLSYKVEVPASRFGWTFVKVVPGWYSIKAFGQYFWDPAVSEPTVTPNGASWTPSEVSEPKQFPLPQFPIMGLIAKVNGGIAYIGEEQKKVNIKNGIIEFGFNERWKREAFEDNSGTPTVELTPLNSN